eukprot:4777675-Karenia_brevis.AAC.1
MMRFAWHPISVKERIQQLEDTDVKHKMKAAYRALMNNTNSESMNFVEEHREFLRKHGRHADERLRKRWP